MKVAIRGLLLLLAVVGLVGLYVLGAWLGLYGRLETGGQPTATRIPPEVVRERGRAQQRAAASLTPAETREILFGDLHVHTTFSPDAFLASLPLMNGEGAHPISDACDYARFCSALDFWSINDHAEGSTPRKWRETRESIRRCNALAGDASDPDVVAFTGWEWSQVGRQPENHYGHKNVIFLGTDDDELPARAIGAGGVATAVLRGTGGPTSSLLGLLDLRNRQRYYDFGAFLAEIAETPACPTGVASPDLPADCYESAETPAELFEKLDQWGFETLVIPHGNTWGFYSPPGISWDKQLKGRQHDPRVQRLIEVMSGHGNSEQYRSFRAVEIGENGEPACPAPSADYLPTCWRAGELALERCRAEGGDDAACAERAAAVRKRAALLGVAGHLVVPDADVEDWLDAGQCRDCFLPAFNYRPGGSTQYALAISNFDDPEAPRRFRFGFLASSDNHRARPGSGYKEFDRKGTTEASGARDATWRRRIRRGLASFDPWMADLEAQQRAVVELGFPALEAERQASFFSTGGLVAVHAAGRSRGEIWDALERRMVYGTSGDRILLWFNLLNAEREDGSVGPVAMGGETRMARAPRFEVRAVGAFRQQPGCPDYATGSLSPERLDHLCRGECYNPSDERKRITRIEVVRIRPQISPDEPVDTLIEDPWRVFECPPSEAGCVVQFEDPAFPGDARDTVYYARAIEEPSPVINGANLRCERDASGNCVRVNPCYGDYRTDASDDCLAEVEERAWSSPIYVDHESL